ncbi:MAG: CBS domain-containing protein, partial [Spirochaetaceae bacterium]
TGMVEVHRYYTEELFEKPVGELMTKAADIISVAPDADVTDAVKIFMDTSVHRLLVMTKGEIVGIISTKDALRALMKNTQ